MTDNAVLINKLASPLIPWRANQMLVAKLSVHGEFVMDGGNALGRKLADMFKGGLVKYFPIIDLNDTELKLVINGHVSWSVPVENIVAMDILVLPTTINAGGTIVTPKDVYFTATKIVTTTETRYVCFRSLKEGITWLHAFNNKSMIIVADKFGLAKFVGALENDEETLQTLVAKHAGEILATLDLLQLPHYFALVQ